MGNGEKVGWYRSPEKKKRGDLVSKGGVAPRGEEARVA